MNVHDRMQHALDVARRVLPEDISPYRIDDDGVVKLFHQDGLPALKALGAAVRVERGDHTDGWIDAPSAPFRVWAVTIDGVRFLAFETYNTATHGPIDWSRREVAS